MNRITKEQYEKLFTQTQANGTAWQQELREEAAENFLRRGFPAKKDELWKYTNLQALDSREFCTPRPVATTPWPAHAEQLRDAHDIEVVFIDGYFSPDQSRIPTTAGLKTELFSSDPTDLKGIISSGNPDITSPLVLLNQALHPDGLVMRLGGKQQLKQRLHIHFIQSHQGRDTITAPRVVLMLGDFSESTIVCSSSSDDEARGLSTAQVDIHLGESAILRYGSVETGNDQLWNFRRTRIYQKSNSVLQLLDATFGSQLCRNDLTVYLDGTGIESTVNGIYALDGNQHADNHTLIDHRHPNCISHQNYKGLLKDETRAVFDGRVFVHPGASDTDSRQLNKNLLLSKKARVDTKPQLEINNDDVKCSHGATIGRLNEQEVFYLLSRGIDRPQAEAMLARAFVEDLLLRHPDTALQHSLQKLLDHYFGA